MASLSSSMSSLRRDVRSDSHDHKRFKDHKTKWAMGTRPLPGIRYNVDAMSQPFDPKAKVRPEKPYTECSCCHESRSKFRKQDAHHEINYGSRSLSTSISDLLPSDPTSPHILEDPSIMYSFDAETAPREAVGLDGLVDRAEKEWMSKETDKIVRDEYAVLDERGEFSVRVKGKGKKGSPRQRAQSVTSYTEDDWERI